VSANSTPNLAVAVGNVRRGEFPFLSKLWHNPAVMQYTDELPSLRGWTRDTAPSEAWREYTRRRRELGPLYTQLIVRLTSGEPIGESFIAPLPEGYEIGPWRKPDCVVTVMGDIKLDRQRWRRGLGTAGMRQVVEWVFRRTKCGLFIVPPHERNRAAARVYEKAGFRPAAATMKEHGHRVMELRREWYRCLPYRVARPD
jgi:RimJ/RimL family protein N-acetyltransferase